MAHRRAVDEDVGEPPEQLVAAALGERKRKVRLGARRRQRRVAGVGKVHRRQPRQRERRFAAERWRRREPRRLRRMARAYGTAIFDIIGQSNQHLDDGIDFGCGLYQSEVDFLIEKEWAQTGEDILMRRSKLGYYADDAMRQKLARYLEDKQGSITA